MPHKIEEKTRAQISKFLPDAIATALRSYETFSQEIPEAGEAKKFGEHHNACKVALAHIELLIKLAKWAGLPDPKAKDHSNQIILKALMDEGLDEIERNREALEDQDDKDNDKGT